VTFFDRTRTVFISTETVFVRIISFFGRFGPSLSAKKTVFASIGAVFGRTGTVFVSKKTVFASIGAVFGRIDTILIATEGLPSTVIQGPSWEDKDHLLKEKKDLALKIYFAFYNHRDGFYSTPSTVGMHYPGFKKDQNMSHPLS
jgi:hypothetical protein